jgi:threonyl-tRNA synthetase
MAKIKLPDGNLLELQDGVTAKQVAERIGASLAKAAIAARVGGQLVDLSTPISGDASIQIITAKDAEAIEILRHSCAHIMAQAICSIWPTAKLVYGPTVQDGFYYDIDLDEPIRPEDFPRIEEKMQEIVKSDLPITRIEMCRAEAFAKVDGDRYKTDNINRATGDTISFYSHGDSVFSDLCRGPHIPSTAKAGSFKLMSVAGAYWHGDKNEKMLQRVYGTAWPTQKQLDEYLTMLEEAKKRDHRFLGKQLDLFSFHDEGPGFAFFHPKGMVIWNSLIDYCKKVNRKYGFHEVKTPIVLNEQLWHRSGHYDNFKDNMYFTTVDNVAYAIKPMNCPGGCLIYKSRPHSYREFPLRMSEFGLVHRYEASGVMHGLVRVRQFTQDDAHIFCTPEQIEAEVISVINCVYEMYGIFGFDKITVALSTKPEKHLGSDEVWEVSTNALANALTHRNLAYKINEGEGAFYGPKIEFQVKDAIGRPWQLGTIQLDFSMPQRFELTFTDKDNTEKTPVMIHRAILGSLERFIGILIEHYGGNMPLWLSPEQMRILTISEKSNDYAKALAERLNAEDFRCGIDLSDEKVNSKIVRAHAERIPYMLVVGPKEAETNSVNVRIRGLKETKTVATDAFIAIAKQKLEKQELPLEI